MPKLISIQIRALPSQKYIWRACQSETRRVRSFLGRQVILRILIRLRLLLYYIQMYHANLCFLGPVSMTSGAARLLSQQLANVDIGHPFHEVYTRLIARDENWISSQWMTERTGGKLTALTWLYNI